MTKIDEIVKSRKSPFSVIPAKAGIHSFQPAKEELDSGFHRSDDFYVAIKIQMFQTKGLSHIANMILLLSLTHLIFEFRI
jgi:hypothetical protein